MMIGRGWWRILSENLQPIVEEIFPLSIEVKRGICEELERTYCADEVCRPPYRRVSDRYCMLFGRCKI